MGIELVQSVLGWCLLINTGLFIVWFLVFVNAHDSIHKFHGRWFAISAEEFESTQYTLMGVYKLITILFFLIPYLVLRSLG